MGSIPLPLHSYQLRSKPASSARLVNCFAEPLPRGARAPYALTRSPGTLQWTSVGNGPISAMHYALGYLWVVSGTRLYRVDSNKAVVNLGDVGVPGRIDIDNNLSVIVVVNEPNAFFYDTASSTFGQLTDPDFTARGATDVEFLDNFLLFVEPNSGRFFGADVGTASSFDALNFATAEGSPDDLVGIKVDHRQALLFGEKSVEIWELAGGAGFPFVRAANGYVEQGCLNGRTAVKVDNSVMWLADDYTIRRLEGLTPVKVSQAGIEQALGSVTIDSGLAWSYSQEGHVFYVLQFSERTFVYDASTKEWAERQTYGHDHWIQWSHAQAFGKEIVGDITSNNIYELSTTTYSDASAAGQLPLRMEWTYQPVYAAGNRAYHDRLEIVAETGVGVTSGQGSDPEIMMDVSDDGGITFESIPNQKMGPLGHYQHNIVWTQLGSSYQRVYRGAVSDPVKVTITDTQLDARGARPFTRRAA